MRGEPEPDVPEGWFLVRRAASEPGRLGVRKSIWRQSSPPKLSAQERQMIVWAHAASPLEACGALLLRNDRVHLVQFDNLSEQVGQFRIPDRDVIALHRLNSDSPGSILAMWHSHPFGRPVPSRPDLRAHPAFAPLLVIVMPRESEVRYYSQDPAIVSAVFDRPLDNYPTEPLRYEDRMRA